MRKYQFLVIHSKVYCASDIKIDPTTCSSLQYFRFTRFNGRLTKCVMSHSAKMHGVIINLHCSWMYVLCA